MMMSRRPDNQAFREGDEVVLALGTYPGHHGRLSPSERGRQLGRYHGAQWRDPQPPGEMAGAFRARPLPISRN